MDTNRLGHSGLRVPALSFGTGTFGGGNDFFKAWGSTDAAGASRLIDICLDHGVTMFDTADVYSDGLAEQILGEAIKGKRNRVLISTKATFPMGDGPNDYGSSRQHLLDGGRRVAQAARRRAHRPLPIARPGLQHARRGDALHARPARARRQDPLHRLLEFLRLASDEVARGVGPLRLSALCRASGLLFAAQSRLRMGADAARPRSGRRRGRLEPARLGQAHRQDPARTAGAARHPRARHSGNRARATTRSACSRSSTRSTRVAKETGKTIPQIALNWLLRRPTVANVIIGARNEEQLLENIGAVGWKLTPEQMAKLDAASDVEPAYPVWHQRGFPQLNERAAQS